MERYEKTFLVLSAAVLVAFLVALAYATIAMHIELPGKAGVIPIKPGQNVAAAVLATAPFNHPGVTKTGPDQYQVAIVAQAWTYYPREIEVPAGARVTFVVTSVDVTHGFEIPGTRVNMMLIPGYISKLSYRFRKPGNYRIICHEYCGILHHTMTAVLRVK